MKDNKLELVDILRLKPGYLKKGAGWLADQFSTSIDDAREALNIVKNETRNLEVEEVTEEVVTKELTTKTKEKYKIVNKNNGLFKVLVVSDVHGIFIDNKAYQVVLEVVKNNEFDEIVFNGDVLDFPLISKHDKKLFQIPVMQNYSEVLEIEFTKKAILKPMRDAAPNANIVFRLGNHEERLTEGKYSVAAERLAKLFKHYNSTELDEMLDLKSMDIEYDPAECRNYFDKFDIVHGLSLAKTAPRNNINLYMGSGTSGHCFSDDTEILTSNGWKKGIDLNGSELVGTMNKNTREFEFNKINKKFVFDDYKELYSIKSQTLDILVTDKHGIIYEDYKGNLKECDAKDLFKNDDRVKILNSCKYSKDSDIKLSENMLRLFINFICDGSISGKNIRWHLKKERKIEHLRELLDSLDFVYSINRTKTGTHKINLIVEDSKKLLQLLDGTNKALPNFIKNLNKEDAEIILNEYSITDGCKNSAATNSYQLSSSKKEELDILQELFLKHNYRTCINNRDRDCNTLTVNTKNGITITKDNHMSIVPYQGKVWCVNVDNGTLIIRRNGKVAITLNSHRLNSTYVKNKKNPYVWVESGCLRTIDNVEYLTTANVADWMQGFVTVTFDTDTDLFYSKTHPIVNGSCEFNGVVYK